MTPLAGSVTATARVNIRAHEASRRAPVLRQLEAGTPLVIRGVLEGEPVLGNASWYATGDDAFAWSGAFGAFDPGSVGVAAPRRPDGTITPLNDAALRSTFGDITHTEGKGGAVKLSPAWVDANIVSLPSPLLADVGYDAIKVHRKAEGPFRRVFAAIAEAGLSETILRCAGTFVPRHKNWDVRRGLSSHSWGIAIDLNTPWNGYGATPAPLGAHGSVRQLVPLFEAEGFAWGGYFKAPSQDGMHFELARTDLP